MSPSKKVIISLYSTLKNNEKKSSRVKMPVKLIAALLKSKKLIRLIAVH